MERLLSLFASAPSNKYFERFLEDETEILRQPIECTYHVKRMKAHLGDWINSVLPEGVEQYMFYMIIIDGIEYEMHQDKCVELLFKIIDGKYDYAHVVQLIGESENVRD